MGQQNPLPIEGGNGWIGEQSDSGPSLESLTVQKVSITAHEVDRYAAGGDCTQRIADLAAYRIRVVIADPGLEQIAQDVERIGCSSLDRKKPEEALYRRRRASVEVQI